MSDLHARLLADLDEYESAGVRGGLVPALRAVVDLHAPTETFPGGTTRIGYVACAGCPGEGYDWEYPDWPCSTIQAIARELGVDG